jgi:hypothetical protein
MGLLELLIVLMFVLWFCGVGFHIGGGLIHLLLVVCVVVLIVRLLRGRGGPID